MVWGGASTPLTVTSASGGLKISVPGWLGSASNARRSTAGLPANISGMVTCVFIHAQRSFYMATVSETGWPYVQHRGGSPGFLRVVDGHTLSFTDLPGNRQFVSVGNLANNDRVALILVDYAHRQRLKLLGRLSVRAFDLAGRAQREMAVRVEAFDWNCPQHIPLRFEAEDVQRALDARDQRIAQLEALLAKGAGGQQA